MKTTKPILLLAAGGALLALSAQAQEVIREKEFPAGEVAAVNAPPIEASGTITGLDSDVLAVRTTTSTTPIQYHYAKSIQWVDEDGNVVTRERVHTGVPVTFYYTRGSTGLVVSKVIVHRTSAQVAPEALEGESTRTTTVERPAPIAEGPAPRVIEHHSTVVKERPVPKVIERPTIVERPAPAIVEKETTTTTTTTTDKKKKHDDDDDDD